MTTLREAAQQALEAFRMCVPMNGKHAEADAAFRNLRAALAQQDEPVEPVAWMCSSPELMAKGYKRFSSRCEGDWNIPVYTAPPQRKPLTDEEIDAEWRELDGEVSPMFMRVLRKFARAVERRRAIVRAAAEIGRRMP